MDAAAAAARPPHDAAEVADVHELLLMAAEYHLMTTEQLFARVLTGVTESRFCACHVLEVVRVASKAVLDERGPAMDRLEGKRALVAELTRLGLLTLDLAWRASTQRRVQGCNKWPRVLFAAAALVNQWMPGVCPPRPRQSDALQQWVATLIKSPELCPNRLLRLELLRFVGMWHPMALAADAELCRTMAVGVFVNLLNLTPRRLLPLDRVGLLWSLGQVLYDLHNADFLRLLTARSAANIQQLRVSHTERALAHVVLLMGRAAFRLLRMRRRGLLSLRATIDEFENLLLVLSLLVTVEPHQVLCEVSGMCQIAASSIAAAAHCIVRIPGASAVMDDSFGALLCQLDDLFLNLATHETTGAVRQELRRHHGRCLARVATKMRRFGHPVLFVPQPTTTSKRPPPKEFLDRRTRRLMEEPVRLEATGCVVDRATLVVLILVDSAHRDLTFTPLPELRDAIQAWREGGGGREEEREAAQQD